MLAALGLGWGCGPGAPPPTPAPPVVVQKAAPPVPPALADPTPLPPGGLCDDPHGPGDTSGQLGDLVVELVDARARSPFEALPPAVGERGAPSELGVAFQKARADAAALLDKTVSKEERAKLRPELDAAAGKAFVLSTAKDTNTRIVLVRFVVDKESKDDFLYMRHDSLLWVRGAVVRVIFQTRGDPTSPHAERIEIDSASDLDGDGVTDAVIDYRFARAIPNGIVFKDHGVYVASARAIWPKGPFGALPAAAWGTGPFAPGPAMPVLAGPKGKVAVATGALTFRCLDEDAKKPLALVRYEPGRWSPVEDDGIRATLDHTCEDVRTVAAWHPVSAPPPEASEPVERRRAWYEQLENALVGHGAPREKVRPVALRAAYLKACP